ncbi:hypothetical protein IAU60_001440 [Kwoniella sp. DSM 27419]
MAKKKKTSTAAAPGSPADAIDSAAEPAAPVDGSDGKPSVHHHHDHEHHHHHSHYARSVDSQGNIRETKTDVVETKEVKEIAASVVPNHPVSLPAVTSIKSVSAVLPLASVAPVQPIKPASVRSVIQPSTVASAPKATITVAPHKPPTVKAPSAVLPPPGSPAGSHRSHRSHHHPEVIVNVTIPPPVAPAAAPAPAPALVPVTPHIRAKPAPTAPQPVKTHTPLVFPSQIPLPASKAPARAPSARSVAVEPTLPAQAIVPSPGQAAVVEAKNEVLEETKVVTTTTTTKRRPATPTTPKVVSTNHQFVQNVSPIAVVSPPVQLPTEEPTLTPIIKPLPLTPPIIAPSSPVQPAASPIKLPGMSKSSSPDAKKGMRMIETTTVERVYIPADDAKAEVEVNVDVDKGFKTVAATGAPTTTGRAAALSAVTSASEPKAGTKGGLRPISMVDYQAMLKQATPKSIRKTPPAVPAKTPTPAAPVPQTVMTMSAQLDRDSKGNEHLHARVRDHTGQVAEVSRGLELDTGERRESDRQRRKREKKEKKLAEKAAALAKDAAALAAGNSRPYRSIGNAAPPPKSDRYAYPPAPTVIEHKAKERFQNRYQQANGANMLGLGAGGGGMGMGGMVGMEPPYPSTLPRTYPAPPALAATRPPMFGPPMMNPMMGMGGMGMGGMGMMGMPMPGMGMPMSTMPMGGMGMSMMGGPVPGVMPGQPGMGYYNSLPGRFGRDMLGRDFAGPGGVGSSQPYRPPDPSALPPMPAGLSFIARPGQEGFDQYGRMLPPELPEGWDGWGRPLVPAGVAPPGPVAPVAAPAAGGQPLQTPMSVPGSRLARSAMGSHGGQVTMTPLDTGTRSGTGRPDQPACFDRPPAQTDSYFRYDTFEAFSLPASSLKHPHQLHLPPEVVSHDVSEDDWAKFIEDLCREALHGAQHLLTRQVRGVAGLGPEPILSEAVHSLLASWAVAFFAPRGIKVYAAQDGHRVLPTPIEPLPTGRGLSHASEWSDAGSDDWDEYGISDEEEMHARRHDMYLPRRERDIRKSERDRVRRRERRRRIREAEVRRGERRGDWEIHFVCATPTVWQPGARPRTYGEPALKLKR